MALPKTSSTIYNTVIPSTKQAIKFKPFTVREQKALLIAQQSEDAMIMVDSLKSVIAACVIDEIDVNDLAIFDLEFLFMQIRSKSVGEVAELLFTCESCGEQTKISFDLTKITVATPEGHNKKIDLGEGLGIVMKYPDVSMLKMMDNFDVNDVELVFDIVISCIDYIYDAEQVHYAKEQTKDELEEFINSLSGPQFAKMQDFFQTMPRLQQPVIYDCPKCKHHHEKVLEGINNFF